MDWKTLLFSFSGRANRAKYWLTVLIVAIAWIVAVIIGVILSAVLGRTFGLVVGAILGLAVFVFAIWAGVAVGLKRLHDREKPGWWLLVFWLLPGVLSGAGSALGGFAGGEPSLAGGALSLVVLGIWVWAIVELGCLKGTTGPNMYGPDPLPAEPD